MKKHKLLLVLTALVMGSAIFVSSCKDDEDTLGLIGSWKVTEATFNPPVDTGGGTVTNAYPMMFPNTCDQDNFFTFQSGGVFIDDEGATKCDPSDDQQDIGSYVHSGSTLHLISSDSTSSDTITLTNVTVNNTTLTGSVQFDSTTIVDLEMSRQ